MKGLSPPNTTRRISSASDAAMMMLVLQCVVSLALLSPCWAFSSSTTSSLRLQHQRRSSALISRVSRETEMAETVGEEDDDDDDNDWATREFFRGAEFLEMLLSPHRPLGCTVEESLAHEIDPTKPQHVFVSKVVEGGYAQQAGIQVGDVVIGVTGLFGELENVMDLGIDKIKGLVMARPNEEPLELRVVRGTAVLEEHEQALVALCSDPSLGASDSEQCVVDYLQGGYDYTLDEPDDSSDSSNEEADEDLVHSLYNMWADDLPDGANGKEKPAAPSQEESKPKPKPWSSRSSPSGTFVRDPTTGEMRNIDA